MTERGRGFHDSSGRNVALRVAHLGYVMENGRRHCYGRIWDALLKNEVTVQPLDVKKYYAAIGISLFFCSVSKDGVGRL